MPTKQPTPDSSIPPLVSTNELYEATYAQSPVLLALRRALNEGVGWFLLAVFSVLVLAAGLRSLTHVLWVYHQGINNEFARTLSARQEPRLDESFTGMQALILSSVNSRIEEHEELCEGQPDPILMSVCVMHKSFQNLIHQASQPHTSTDSLLRLFVEDLRSWSPTADQTIKVSYFDAIKDPCWLKGTRAAIAHLQDSSFSIPPGICAFGKASHGLHSREYGQSACIPELISCSPNPGERPDNSDCEHSQLGCVVTTIPSLHNTPGTINKEGATRPPYTARIARAVQVSSVLDELLFPFLRAYPLHEYRPADYQVVQVYFISVDSVLSIWGRFQQRPEDIFPPTRMWAANNYFQKLLLTESRDYTTKAYLDFSGYGVIRTYCTPTIDHHTSTLLGILCTDYTIPHTAFLDELHRSSLTSFDYIEYTEDSSDYSRISLLRGWKPVQSIELTNPPPLTSGIPNSRGEWRQILDTERDALISELSMMRPSAGILNSPSTSQSGITTSASSSFVSDNPERNSRLFSSDILEVSRGATLPRFLVPIGMSSPAKRIGILVRPKAPGPPRAFYPALAVSCVGFVLLVFSWSFGSSKARKASSSGRQLSILQDLQIGVLISNEEDCLEYANYHAQALLGIKVLFSQTPDDAGSLSFSNLIHPTVILADSTGEPRKAVAYRPVIENDRRNGQSSDYFARLAIGTCTMSWVFITGSPLLYDESTRRKSPRTFAIVRPAVRIDWTTLDNLVRQYEAHGERE